MGYRNYLYIIDKDKLEQSRNLKKEDIETYKTAEYISNHRLAEQIGAKHVFEFGKDIDWTKFIKEDFRQIFNDEDLNNTLNTEGEFVELDYKALEKIIDIYRNKILNWFKELHEKDDIKYFKQSVEDKIFEWANIETNPVNEYNLTSSWKYEYEYFTLLHILSIVDPDKQILLWLGW